MLSDSHTVQRVGQKDLTLQAKLFSSLLDLMRSNAASLFSSDLCSYASSAATHIRGPVIALATALRDWQIHSKKHILDCGKETSELISAISYGPINFSLTCKLSSTDLMYNLNCSLLATSVHSSAIMLYHLFFLIFSTLFMSTTLPSKVNTEPPQSTMLKKEQAMPFRTTV